MTPKPKPKPLPFSVEDIEKVRNDSQLPAKDIMAIMQREGVAIQYGHLLVFVRGPDLQKAREHVAAIAPDVRRHVMQNVSRSLDKNVPKINKGRASKKTCDDTYQDLMLWHVLKESTAS